MNTETFTFASSHYVPIATGLFQFVTGIWLLYCTYAITVNQALGAKAWI